MTSRLQRRHSTYPPPYLWICKFGIPGLLLPDVFLSAWLHFRLSIVPHCHRHIGMACSTRVLCDKKTPCLICCARIIIFADSSLHTSLSPKSSTSYPLGRNVRLQHSIFLMRKGGNRRMEHLRTNTRRRGSQPRSMDSEVSPVAQYHVNRSLPRSSAAHMAAEWRCYLIATL